MIFILAKFEVLFCRYVKLKVEILSQFFAKKNKHTLTITSFKEY